jgi:hypothetical protein
MIKELYSGARDALVDLHYDTNGNGDLPGALALASVGGVAGLLAFIAFSPISVGQNSGCVPNYTRGEIIELVQAQAKDCSESDFIVKFSKELSNYGLQDLCERAGETESCDLSELSDQQWIDVLSSYSVDGTDCDTSALDSYRSVTVEDGGLEVTVTE